MFSFCSVGILRRALFVQPNAIFARLCIVGLCLVASHCGRKKEDPHLQPPPRVHVDTVEAKAQPVPQFLPITGSVEAGLETDLAANATGRVVSVHMERYSTVEKGAVLVKLDVRQAALQAAVAQVQSTISDTNATLQAQELARSRKLVERGAGNQAEYEQRQLQTKTSQDSLAAAKLQAAIAAQSLHDGTIRAPFSGKVAERWVEVGQYVLPNTKIATLISPNVLKLKATVSEAHLTALKTGLTLRFRVVAYKEREFLATLVRVAPVVRATTRDVSIEAEVSDPAHLLIPGMFAQIALPLAEVPLPVVPSSALVTDGDATHVFVVRDGRIEEHAVEVGPRLGEGVAVVKGVAPGDRVVRKPGPDVKNGLLAD